MTPQPKKPARGTLLAAAFVAGAAGGAAGSGALAPPAVYRDSLHGLVLPARLVAGFDGDLKVANPELSFERLYVRRHRAATIDGAAAAPWAHVTAAGNAGERRAEVPVRAPALAELTAAVEAAAPGLVWRMLDCQRRLGDVIERDAAGKLAPRKVLQTVCIVEGLRSGTAVPSGYRAAGPED